MRACSTSPASPPLAAAGSEAASMTNPTAINRYIARNSKTSSQDRSRNKLGSRRRIATPRFLSAADGAQGRPSNHAIWSRCHLYVTWAEVPVRFWIGLSAIWQTIIDQSKVTDSPTLFPFPRTHQASDSAGDARTAKAFQWRRDSRQDLGQSSETARHRRCDEARSRCHRTRGA